VSDWRNLAQLIDDSARRFPTRAFHFPKDAETATLPEVARRSDRLAGGLAAQGIRPGDIVALLHPTSADFLAAFFGVLKAGAVPTVLPQPFSRSATSVERIEHILKDAGVRLLSIHPMFADYVAEGLPSVIARTNEELARVGAGRPDCGLRGRDLALVQYTSGSTSLPKGVALSHDAIRAGIASIVERIELDEHDVNGQWIPLHHDMGLIGMLAGICAGVEQYLWPPTEFVRRPAEWLRSFAECRATIFAGPSFAYGYLLAACDAEAARAIDLSAWRVAFNGSEQVDPQVLMAFVERFASAGLRRDVVLPVYGLAEATLAATIPLRGEAPHVDWVDRARLANEGCAVPVDASHTRARGVACTGPPVAGLDLRLAPQDGSAVADRRVAEIQLRGPAVMERYLGRERDPESFTADGWFRTGDLGYRIAERLFVTGRQKEMIVVRGENLYPADVEALVQGIPGVHLGRCVAFGFASDDRDRLAVVVETARQRAEERSALARTVRATIGRELGLADVEVVPTPIDRIRRTTSGKPRRAAMRALFVDGELDEAALYPVDETGDS